MDVPLPSLCPEERARVRLAWRNERTLYRRKCDATGKTIVSIFDQGTSFPVYEQQYWWSDGWDAFRFGRDVDFSRPFFSQLAGLFSAVPQCALRCPQSENSEYTNQCEKNKDCYLIFCSNGSRECLHGMWYQQCTECIDCTYLEKSELCYEVLNGKNCYRCTFSENLRNCAECHFSRDLIGCSNCIGCANLRNKEYYIENERVSSNRYRERMQELGLHRHAAVEKLRLESGRFTEAQPWKFYCGKNNEESNGDYLEYNRRVVDSFNCRNSENLFHCRDAWSGRNSLDLTETLLQDFCIALEGCYHNVGCGFSGKISETHDTWYCSHCFNSKDLFGCVGLKHHQFCILNKQYSRDEYQTLRGKLVQYMKHTEEWGQYIPASYSPFGYDESVAYEYFPLSKEEVLAQGLRWKERETVDEPRPQPALPESIFDAGDEILEQTLVCASSGRSYRLQKTELLVYRKLGVPLPRLHPDVRHAARMVHRNPRKLRAGNCELCRAPFETCFPPESEKVILCEDCYNQTAV